MKGVSSLDQIASDIAASKIKPKEDNVDCIFVEE